MTEYALRFVWATRPSFLATLLDRQPNGRETHRFWQRGGGFDRNLWEPDAIWASIDYIHTNPVRRKLCNRPADWHWSSAARYDDPPAGPVPVQLEFLPARIEMVRRRGIVEVKP